jgi:hypothetical protein
LKKKGGNTDGAPKKDFGTIPYFLVIADYEKAFLYVALKYFLSDMDKQAQQMKTLSILPKHFSVLAH